MMFFIFDLEIKDACFIALAGTLGMILDSIIGSKWQLKHIHKGIVTEDTGNTLTQYYKGVPWMSSNMVNMLTNMIVTGTSVVILGLYTGKSLKPSFPLKTSMSIKLRWSALYPISGNIR
ncbi:MAG: DUF92 domain-containing protein [Saprospiraceae bacterium]|nr:DUF92 domain-containing protein [Saprospiraceae bacterium]